MKIYTGTEPLQYNQNLSGAKVIDFWRWYASNLLRGTLRGAFAEFIVAVALGIDVEEPRDSFAEFDLIYGNAGIEVKSCSATSKRISFDIAQRMRYSPQSKWADKKRHSSLYVFCLINEQREEYINPLDLNQWDFFILSTAIIEQTFGEQKTVGLEMIKPLAIYTKYDGIQQAVDMVIES